MIIILSYIIFLYMTLFKVVASSSEEKVPDFSEQCSRRISLVVGAYWNPWPTLIFRHSRLMSSLSPTESSFIGRKPALYVSIFFFLTLPNKLSDTTKKSVHIFTGVQAGTPPQRAPITAGPRHRSLKNVKTRYYLKTTGVVPSEIMGSVTGQAYRFERARVIRDVGCDKSLFVSGIVQT